MTENNNEEYKQHLAKIFDWFDFEEEADASEQGYDLAKEIILLDVPENDEQMEMLVEKIGASGGEGYIMEALVRFIMIEGITDKSMPWVSIFLDNQPRVFIEHAVGEKNIAWGLAHSLPGEYNESVLSVLLDIIDDYEFSHDQDQDEDEIEDIFLEAEQCNALMMACSMAKCYPELEGVLMTNPAGLGRLMDRHGANIDQELTARTKKLLLENEARGAQKNQGQDHNSPKLKM